jgi:poly(hydroxyalkanoate) granule-associated protein
MAQKKRTRSTSRGRDDGARAVRDSAQKIWLAGLGAFERAREEGPRMFDGLVAQGRTMGARAVGMADQALKSVRSAKYDGGRWDKIEQVFEERVARSLKRLGVLTRDQVEELSGQIRELNQSLQALAMAAVGPMAAKHAARPHGARKARTTARPHAAHKARTTARRATRKAASRSRAKRAA